MRSRIIQMLIILTICALLMDLNIKHHKKDIFSLFFDEPHKEMPGSYFTLK